MRIKRIISRKERKNLIKAPLPQWVSPMLATLTHDYFNDEDWI